MTGEEILNRLESCFEINDDIIYSEDFEKCVMIWDGDNDMVVFDHIDTYRHMVKAEDITALEIDEDSFTVKGDRFEFYFEGFKRI